jgi:hypothetical protein
MSTNPNYLTLKLFTNYGGLHHGFATTSVSDTNNADPNPFSSHAALTFAPYTATLLVVTGIPWSVSLRLRSRRADCCLARIRA